MYGISKQVKMSGDGNSIMYIATNAILPFDPRKMKLVLGSAEYIAIEVFARAHAGALMKPEALNEGTIIRLDLTLPLVFGSMPISVTGRVITCPRYLKLIMP